MVYAEYPVIYHVKCEFWSGVDLDSDYDYRIWDDEMIGYGTKYTVPNSVKECIDSMIQRIAILFFKVRGEL